MTYRILSAQLSHETNTFSNAVTDMAAFKRRIFVENEGVMKQYANTSTELGAHIAYAQENNWKLIQPFAAHGTPSGPVTAHMLNYCIDRLVEQAAYVDGAILALHGAMVAENADDAEGYLLSKVRQALGPTKPLVITLDTHANITDEMARHVNGIFIYRTYPHVDQFPLALEACAHLSLLLKTGKLTHTTVFRLPMLDGCDHGRTHGSGPFPELLKKAQEIHHAHQEIHALELAVGFPWSDIEQVGPSVVVTTEVPEKDIRETLRPLLKDIWNTRDQRSINLLSLDQVIKEIENTPIEGGPIVIADFSDNPGHGAPGDGVALLRYLADTNILDICVASICDPEAVQTCFKAGIGKKIHLEFGSKKMPELYGASFTGLCEVIHLGDGDLVIEGPMRKGSRLSLGQTATVRCGNLSVILATNNIQVQDLAFFRSNGIEPTHANVLVVKSQQHFRAAFEPISRNILLADSGGFVSSNFKKLTYIKARRPIWPLDEIPQELVSL